jgi:hypothetical protein
VDMDGLEGLILALLQVVNKLEHHLQILSAAADKAACPPLVEVAGVGLVRLCSRNRPDAAPMYSNIIKTYANWNVCFSCGFDVEDGHTSKTCPAPWRRANHQEGFD